MNAVSNLMEAENYIKTEEDASSLETLNKMFLTNIKPDGVRSRAYLKLIWDKKSDVVSLAKNQSYFQTAVSNQADGGKIRKFAVMDSKVLDLAVVKNMIRVNLEVIKNYAPLDKYTNLVLGMHFIQYKAEKFQASYSSPDTLHVDDEPLVFIHLLNLSDNALGGDNLLANLKTREITNVVRLEKPFETMILTKDYLHAVTPLGSRNGTAQRDIILFTVEPIETQVEVAQ